jgi:hypothetical protein
MFGQMALFVDSILLELARTAAVAAAAAAAAEVVDAVVIHYLIFRAVISEHLVKNLLCGVFAGRAHYLWRPPLG